jgi:hypothetical protein
MGILSVVNLWPPFSPGADDIVIIAGPYTIDAAQVYVAGPAVAHVYVAGAYPGMVFKP